MDERKSAQLLRRQQQRGNGIKKDSSNRHSCSCEQKACPFLLSVFVLVHQHLLSDNEGEREAWAHRQPPARTQGSF